MKQNSGPRIALVGECMIQLQQLADGNIHKTYAGDTFNTATYLARLACIHGAEVHYLTALGTDQFSNDMLATWRQENIHCDHVRRISNKLPGLYYVHIDDQGERTFSYWRDNSAAKELFKDTTTPSLSSLAEYDCIYVSGISFAILDEYSRERLLGLLIEARSSGSIICFDNNYRAKLWPDLATTQAWYRRILDTTDIAFLTFDDEQAIWQDPTPSATIVRYADTSIAELVIKCGAEPCIVKTADFSGQIAADTINPDKIIDTNAAGDSFSAGYLCGRLSNTQNSELNATIGHKVAGTVIQNHGAVIERNALKDTVAAIQKLVQQPINN
ncbi:MAG TPA: ketodeoxygluconokinase [Oceanospirillaceae bacterium]|nr:ketodeoxygluconokinase [Oceanospirillaceae bacterium]